MAAQLILGASIVFVLELKIGGLIRALMILAVIDLAITVSGPGPIKKFLYPGLRDEI